MLSHFCLFVFVIVGHKLYNERGRHPSRRVLDLSPIETPGPFIQGQNRRANQKKLKQRRLHRPIDGVYLRSILLLSLSPLLIMDAG